jgi:hypothetical protein
LGYTLSKAFADEVTWPKGDPPDGGSKIAFSVRSSVRPPGVSSWIGEPTTRWCFFA